MKIPEIHYIILKCVSEYIQNDQQNYDQHEIIRKALVPCEGEVITHTKVKKYLGGKYTLTKQHGNHYIIDEFDVSHQIATSWNEYKYSESSYEIMDACSGSAALERIKSLNEFISDLSKLDLLSSYFKNLKEAWELFIKTHVEMNDNNFTSYEFPPFYRVLSTLEIPVPSSLISEAKKYL